MLPEIVDNIRKLKHSATARIARIKHYQGKHFCPCCKGRVIAFNNWQHVQGETCPHCGSARRHRLLHLFLTQHAPVMFEARKCLLHIAPENYLRRLFQKNPSIEYISADLSMENVMVKMDITDIQFPDDSFDFIICNHVLEHVIEDRKAMKEFCRVLNPGGFAVLQVPVYPDKTIEDSSVVDPQERKRLFGLEDHVRKYGQDYKQRLEESGFIVKTFAVKELFTHEQIIYFGLYEGETIYTCFKTEKGFQNIRIDNLSSYH